MPGRHQKGAASSVSASSLVNDNAATHAMDLRIVRRTDQEPVAAASVEVYYWANESPHEIKQATDEKGHCRVAVPPGTIHLAISVAKDGLVPTQEVWSESKIRQGLPAALKMDLAPGSPIGGLVTDQEGRPVAGALVTIGLDRRPNLGPDIDVVYVGNFSVHGGFPSLTVKTGAQGRWRCSVLPEDAERDTRLLFSVEHPDFVSDTNGFARRLSIKTARAMTGAFPLRKGIQVGGAVHDAHGQTVPSARVVLAYSANYGNYVHTKTDASGRFLFANVDDRTSMGRFCVSVEAKGFSPAWKMLVPHEAIPVLDFELRPAKPLTGRVIDSRGRPVVGANVEPRWQECHHIEFKTTTDSDGRFVWLSAPDEGEIEFLVSKSGFMRAVQRRVSTQTREASITINPIIRIRGTVIDAKTGQPIPAFQVSEGRTVGNSRLTFSRGGTAAQEGRYDVSPFTYDGPGTALFVQITARGYQPSTSRAIVPGEEDVVIDFKLEKGTGPSGLVKLPDGSPASGADVYLNSPKYGLPIENNRQSFLQFGADQHWVKTDSQGRFAFQPKDEPFGVFVFHSKGVAQKSSAELEQ
jgi:protocatechuate 3,4-dioxygenase beta subunit